MRNSQVTKVSESIKLAVLQKYLCDGEHLNLQSSRLTTYDLARKEAVIYLRAKQTWTAPGGSDPMDLSPLGKGKGGKKGKGNGKGDKSVKPKECFYCGKPGHNKNECRNFSAALRKKSVQPGGSDQDVCLFPLSMVDECNDSPEDLRLCRARCFSIRELQGRCAQQRSDKMFQSSHQKRSHCIRRTARVSLISVPSSSAWV